MSMLTTFNRRVPYPIRLLSVLFVGLLLYGSLESAMAIAGKISGGAADCPWPRTALFGFDLLRLGKWRVMNGLRLTLQSEDATLGIEQFSTGSRAFWIKKSGTTKNGKELLSYLLSDHSWMAEVNGRNHVKKGDIVLDCGAHVGVFTDIALRRGASKVVAIEPDPVNLECLRRNFPSEIAAGVVVLVPKGVWSSEKTLTLYTGTENSGTNSMIFHHKGAEISVPVTTIDRLVEELHLGHVDFIKMDIEGAEREALRGGFQTLARDIPTLMMDMYHRPDDLQVLPAVIHEGNSHYQMTCGPCEETLSPHVSYFHR
jgi:FkbM family methyltransferase